MRSSRSKVDLPRRGCPHDRLHSSHRRLAGGRDSPRSAVPVPVPRARRTGLRRYVVPVLRPDRPRRADSGMLRSARNTRYDATMKREDRESVTSGSTRPVRMWITDAQWVRREAFERAVPAAILMAEVLDVYRQHAEGR